MPNNSMDAKVTTATLFERRWLNPKLRVGGFAPHHLKRFGWLRISVETD